MSSLPQRLPCVAGILLGLLLLTIPASGLTFEQIKMLYERRMDEVTREDTEAKAKLIASYDRELEELLGRFAASGDLDRALAVKTERERIEKRTVEEEPEFNKPKHSQLTALRDRFERGLARAVATRGREEREAREKYVALLGKEIEELTRAGKLEKAVEARGEKTRVEEMLADDEEEETTDDEAPEDLLTRLVGTTWTWQLVGESKENRVSFLPEGQVRFSWTGLPGTIRRQNDGTVEVEGGDWARRGIDPYDMRFDLEKGSFKGYRGDKYLLRGRLQR